jgi:hypothetical protein
MADFTIDLCDDEDEGVVDLTRDSGRFDAEVQVLSPPKKRKRTSDVEFVKTTSAPAASPSAQEATDKALAEKLAARDRADQARARRDFEAAARKKREADERRDGDVARKLAADERRDGDVARKLAADEAKRAKKADDAARAKKAKDEEVPDGGTPMGLAMRYTDGPGSLRDCDKDGLSSKNTAINFDHAVKFFEMQAKMLARAPVKRSGSRRGERSTPLTIVYHGTSRANFRKIMDGNLAVPDGRSVKHATDDGYFGRGIYTSTRHELAFAYAKDAIVFACLALPGKQHKATQKHDRGKPKRAGFDSHLGYEGDGCPQLVFFDSDQLLPCYLVDRQNWSRAEKKLRRAIADIAKAAGNARPDDGLPRSRKGKGLPAPGCFAGGGPPAVGGGGGAAKFKAAGLPPAFAAYLKTMGVVPGGFPGGGGGLAGDSDDDY